MSNTQQYEIHFPFLLLSSTSVAAMAAGGTSVLTANLEVPVVTKTLVKADLLHALQVITKLSVQSVGSDVHRLTLAAILLSVDEPIRNAELDGVLDDGLEVLHFLLIELTRTEHIYQSQHLNAKSTKLS